VSACLPFHLSVLLHRPITQLPNHHSPSLWNHREGSHSCSSCLVRTSSVNLHIYLTAALRASASLTRPSSCSYLSACAIPAASRNQRLSPLSRPGHRRQPARHSTVVIQHQHPHPTVTLPQPQPHTMHRSNSVSSVSSAASDAEETIQIFIKTVSGDSSTSLPCHSRYLSQ
jgi:hypothetical protein